MTDLVGLGLNILQNDLITGRQHSLLCKPYISYDREVCLSVRPSTTRWHWVKTAQARITTSSPTDSQRTLVLGVKIHPQIRKGSPRAIAKTKVLGLSIGEDIVIPACVILTQASVWQTYRQTDNPTVANVGSAYSKLCWRCVKNQYGA